MSYLAKPKVAHPGLPRNEIGLTRRDYEGGMSTLCAGCGHDSVTAAIVRACFELSLPPHRVAKLSGIGCSSKTPAYFLNAAHGFNAVHGRMPAVATGANAANRDITYIGVSGDGDGTVMAVTKWYFGDTTRSGIKAKTDAGQPTLIDAAEGEPIDGLDGRSFLPVLLGDTDEHNEVVYGVHTTRGIIAGTPGGYPIRSIRTGSTRPAPPCW